MQETTRRIAGLETVVCTPESSAVGSIVLLHGFAMRPADLAPFAHSLGVSARFYFPQGITPIPKRGFAWWSIDEEARAVALRRGPRDLAEADPSSRPVARAALEAFLGEIAAAGGASPLVLGGFSQGGMLACDALLQTAVPIAGLVMMSASRLAIGDWQTRASRLRQLPVFVSHGLDDADLAFSAGERLRDWLTSAGADVNWVPFRGGHQIPMVVWRELRRFFRKWQV